MARTIVATKYLLIPIAKLHPRKINPNRMSAAAFASYKREVERLGKPPKPIVIRPLGNGEYEIIDGEHAWRCATELGFASVVREVRKVDKFEASLECFKRNRGGKDDPVVLGRMFREMMRSRKLSIRALAKDLGISEGKVRVYLEYLKAFEMRIKYAPNTAEEDISRLTQTQMRKYISMPNAVCDRWLDAGADPSVFEGYGEWTPDRVPHEIHRCGLAAYLDDSSKGFEASVRRLANLAMWLDGNKHIVDVKPYVVAVAESRLPFEVIDKLPVGKHDNRAVALINNVTWEGLLVRAKERAYKRSGLLAEIEAGVRLSLR